MTQETKNKESKSSETTAILKETAYIAASNAFCTLGNFPLETVKNKKQDEPKRSYVSIVKSLYEKGGQKRFYKGYASYMARNTTGCFVGTGAMVASIHATKDSDEPIYSKMAKASLAEGLAESSLFFPFEVPEKKEIFKSKNQHNQHKLFTKEIIQKGVNAVGFAATRNVIFGAGIVIPYMMDSSKEVSFASGMAAGLISLPFDVATTKAFTDNTNPIQTMSNMLKANKRLALAGGAIRGVQIGVYSLATNLALHYNESQKQQSIGR